MGNRWKLQSRAQFGMGKSGNGGVFGLLISKNVLAAIEAHAKTVNHERRIVEQ